MIDHYLVEDYILSILDKYSRKTRGGPVSSRSEVVGHNLRIFCSLFKSKRSIVLCISGIDVHVMCNRLSLSDPKFADKLLDLVSRQKPKASIFRGFLGPKIKEEIPAKEETPAKEEKSKRKKRKRKKKKPKRKARKKRRGK